MALEVKKAWQTLLDGWPIFAVIGAILVAVITLWFNNAVDERIKAAGLISPAHLMEIQNDIEALEKELHNGRTKGDITANKEAIGRVEDAVNRVDGKVDQLLIILTQD